jgi:hypothetical protein
MSSEYIELNHEVVSPERISILSMEVTCTDRVILNLSEKVYFFELSDTFREELYRVCKQLVRIKYNQLREMGLNSKLPKSDDGMTALLGDNDNHIDARTDKVLVILP